jgi:hypothetical protein
MAVTITTNTLSSRVRYLNVSASTANADAKDVVLAMANALIAMGWSRFDTAGATAVVGTNDNAGVILRRACYDNAQSGHFNYLGLRLTGSGTNTYTFHLIQAADWSNTTSMSAFVGGAAAATYTPNSTGRTNFLNFAQGGTIWLFDSGRTLVITSQSGSTLIKGLDSTWLVGEYKKEFGENVNAATGYIHNGVFTCNRWLMDGNGTGLSDAGDTVGHTAMSGFVTYGASAGGPQYQATPEAGMGWYAYPTQATRYLYFTAGTGYSQFVLTEAPAVSAAADALSRNTAAPAACGKSFTTRMLMGYFGYVGHTTFYSAMSVNHIMRGSMNDVVTGASTIATSTDHRAADIGSPVPFGATNSSKFTLLNSIQEYSPTVLPTNLKFVVYEPTLSCGTSNGLATTWTLSNTQNMTYSGPQYKFSMLGRIFDMKIFGPYTSEKYTFLDSMTIPCDSDGFYSEQGTNKDFWVIPTSNFTALVMPK